MLSLRSDKLLETGLGAGGGVGNMELVTLKGAMTASLICYLMLHRRGQGRLIRSCSSLSAVQLLRQLLNGD